MQKNNLLKEKNFLHAAEVMQNLIAQWEEQLNLMYIQSSGSLLNLEMGLFDESIYKETLETINENIKQLISTMKYFNDYFNKSNEITFFNLENCIQNSLTLLQLFLKKSKIIVYTTYSTHIEICGVETEMMQVFLNILNDYIYILTQNRSRKKRYILISTQSTMNQIEISIKSNSKNSIEFLKKSPTLPTSTEIIEENFNGKIQIKKEEFYIKGERFCSSNFTITLNK
ncbi:MAG: hypothetical protein ACNI3C_11965 [Candidatus Marinarcus sp.]|uniref:hypothetical protein n=1 Tax=Candidatus Marinarcus sp. TaxID=3100987 RepID=UPI003B006FD0